MKFVVYNQSSSHEKKKPVENCDDAKPTFKSLHTFWEKSYICAQLLVLLWDLVTRYM